MYWELKGKYQEIGETLEKLIPQSGAIENADDKPKLERYRLICNAYYDLYNNGGCNPGRRTAYYFPKAIYWFERSNLAECAKITEPILDKAILLAAKESGLTV